MSNTGLGVFDRSAPRRSRERFALEERDRTLQKTNVLINELAEALEIEDRHLAFQGLRAVLHALRDRLPLEEAVQLGGQLPALLAGFYYQGWKPASTPTKERSVEAFVDKVKANLHNSDYPIASDTLLKTVFLLLDRWVSRGEIEDIIQMLPKEVKSFLPDAVST